jgi:quaternary ammonium compound-resistance protein SugE
MSNPWIILLIAGLCEIGWAIGLKYSDGFTRPVATAVTLVVALASFVLLSQAMKEIPVGTAYAVWTGIGALGVAILGIVLFQEAVTPLRLAGVGLIVAGIVALKLA